jgi:hypothetical protein
MRTMVDVCDSCSQACVVLLCCDGSFHVIEGKHPTSTQLLKCTAMFYITVSPPQTRIPCAGLTVADFDDDEPLSVAEGATVTLVRCSFTRNSEQTEFPYAHAAIGAYELSAEATRGLIVIFLQQCTFKDNHAFYDVLKYSEFVSADEDFAVIYSDDAALKVLQASLGGEHYTTISPEPLSAVPADRLRINCSSAWLQMAQQVCSSSLPNTHHVWLLLSQPFVHA